MNTDGTGRDSDKFMLRLPDGMRDSLKKEAQTNKRTLNAEIVARLEASLAPHSDIKPSNAFEVYATEVAKAAAAETAEQMLETFKMFLGRQTVERSQAWRNGYDCFDLKGWSGESENPFKLGDPQRLEWVKGFLAAANWLERNASFYEPRTETSSQAGGFVVLPHRDDPEPPAEAALPAKQIKRKLDI